MASILDSLKDMIADNQHKTEMQMAELHARQERDREDNLRMHEESCRMHEENSCLMQQQQQLQDLLLEFLTRMHPALRSAPTMAPPMLGNVATGSGMSGSPMCGSSCGRPVPLQECHSSADHSNSPNAAPTPPQQRTSPSSDIVVALGDVAIVDAPPVQSQSLQRSGNVEDASPQLGGEVISYSSPNKPQVLTHNHSLSFLPSA